MMTFVDDKPIFDAIRAIGGPMTQRDVAAINAVLFQVKQTGIIKPLFDIARELDDDDDGLDQVEVDILDAAIRAAKGEKPQPLKSGRRRINAAGLALVKASEGLRLKAYLCPAKVWTIGYGSTGPHVTPGMVITEAEAERLLLEDLERFEVAVANAAPNATDNQFSAMVSLAFNIGIGAFLKSSVLRLHRARSFVEAGKAFGMWVKAKGKILPGLVTRRAAETALYRKP
jgi:lysozyme